MAVMNLNLVQMTVVVGSMKPASADRIGSGLVTDFDNYPANSLSPGHLSQPRVPEPEPRSRQEFADVMSMPTFAAAPVSSTGTVSGACTCRRSLRPDFAPSGTIGSKRTISPTPTAITAADEAGAGRLRCHGSPRSSAILDRDCQSLDDRRELDREQHPRSARWQSHRRTWAATTKTAAAATT